MSQELLIAIVSGAFAIAVEVVRRTMRFWAETQLRRANIMKEISDRQREDNVRVVNMMIDQARSDARLVEEIHLISQKLDAAVEARERADETRMRQITDMSQRIEKIGDMMSNYVEFRSSPVYRLKRED